MSGDYSRHTFDPLKGYTATLLEQGRVALDSDWNEWVASIERRLRAGTVDTIGRATVPSETPNGFKITATGSGANRLLTIGRGRIYVEGLLAENHGDSPDRFDLVEPDASGHGSLGVLGELIGSDTIPYLEQPFLSAAQRPYLPAPDPLPGSDGPHVVYLDVWQREITSVEDPQLLEPALGGVDTSTRMQTVWQVRLLPDVGADSACSSPDAMVPGWLDVTSHSAGRLTTEEVPVPQDDDPCLIPAGAGYKGLENQLYRVEIHRAGTTGAGAGGARFKWSRENASIATRVEAVTAPDTVIVKSLGRDEFLTIMPGNWIEITDDKRELAGRSGDMRKVKAVERATRTITLTSGMAADLVPPGTGGDTLEARRTRVRKWDHQGKILDHNGNQLVDLDSDDVMNDDDKRGTIPLPPGTGGVQLEAGILLRFDAEPNSGRFKVADYWNFAARSATGTFEKLDRAPPRGIHHHYCRLALVTFPGPAKDCRVLWPPAFGADACACDVCVSPEDHNSQRLTIQRAIDMLREKGGTVCLQSGDYLLGETPIRMSDVTSLRIVGKGSNTILTYLGPGAALQIEGAQDVELRNLTFAFAARGDLPGGGVSLRHSSDVAVDECYFLELSEARDRGIAIELSGLIQDARLTNNFMLCGHGFVSRTADNNEDYLILADVSVSENRFLCSQRGIDLTGRAAYYDGEVRIGDNFLRGCEVTCIGTVLSVLNEDVPTPCRLRIARNMMLALGNGIIAGAGLVEVTANTVRGLARAVPKTGARGIVLAATNDGVSIFDGRIVDNTIVQMRQEGILIDAASYALTVSRNTLTGIYGSGLFFTEKATTETAIIESNQMSRLCVEQDDRESPAAGVLVNGCTQLRFSGNVIRDVATKAEHSQWFAGVEVIGCVDVSVDDNNVSVVGPPRFFGIGFGIVVAGFATAALTRNQVSQLGGESADASGSWYGLVAIAGFAKLVKNYAAVALASRRSLYLNAKTGPVRIDALGARPYALLAGSEARADQNRVDGAGGGAAQLIYVTANDACQFHGNVAQVAQATHETVVELQAGTIQASDNRAARPDKAICMTLTCNRHTVLGNVTTSVIKVNGADLQPPWAALNIT